MQSDNLIKKLLKAAAICETVYFGLSFLTMFFSRMLISIFGNLGHIEIGFGEMLGVFLPEIVFLIVSTAAFFAVWYLFDKAVDPTKYIGIFGVFLAVLVVFGAILGYAANVLFNVVATRRYRIEIYSQLVSLRGVVSFFGYINTAAVTLMWIAFGMEWYRDRLIREQAEAAKNDSEQSGESDVPSEENVSAQAEDTDDNGWESYRSALVREQTAAEPPQDFIFNNKQ